MPRRSGRKRDWTRFLGWLVAGVVTLLGGGFFAAWLFLGGGAWRGEVRIVEGELLAPDHLVLLVDSCNGAPTASVEETDHEVRIRVRATSTPLFGGTDCLDPLEVRLREPLGDRDVIDLHTGASVTVRR